MGLPRLSSFRAQIVIIAIASVATVGLAAVLVRDVITRTEGRLLDEARQQCIAATRELKMQYRERAAYADEAILGLPLSAQDLSLKGLSGAVLRSYEGIAGGFWVADVNRVIGQSGTPPGEREMELIRSLNRGGPTARVFQFGADLIVVAADDVDRNAVAWTRKRLEGVRDPVGARRRWLIGGLVVSVVLGMGGIVSIWLFLRRGIAAVQTGLRALEQDFAFRLPAAPGDFGQIAGWINRMAENRARLEADVRRQDRLAALGTVVAGVAHEIRNPLNSIKLTLELLDRRLQRGAASSDEVRVAISEVDRLNRIVNRLLLFGKPAFEDRHPQPILPLVERASKMVQEQAMKKGIAIDVTPGGEECEADVDAPQIEQVLINLLLNAIDASPDGEVVSVAVKCSNGDCRVTVGNRGLSLSGEARARLFDAYFTTKPSGTGLGLSVSRKIAMNHGGSLDFESSDGYTEFLLRLPERSVAPS